MRLALLQIVERDIALFGVLIIEHRMTLAERAALDILAGQAHRMAFRDQRTERQGFRRRPIETFAGLDHLGAVILETLDGPVNIEASRNFGKLLADFLERLYRQSGLAAALFIGIVGRPQTAPGTVQPVGLVRLVVPGPLRIPVRDFRAMRRASFRGRPR